jgi:cytochrome oxidase Cu insertion factor (SCO1/SenC/PrrC family)
MAKNLREDPSLPLRMTRKLILAFTKITAMLGGVVMILGNQAPDFTTSALVNGNTKNISLSDYKGKWVILFFYSGDFSFV